MTQTVIHVKSVSDLDPSNNNFCHQYFFLSTTYPYWAISGDSYENWNRVKKEFGKYLDMHVAVFLKFNREDVSVS